MSRATDYLRERGIVPATITEQGIEMDEAPSAERIRDRVRREDGKKLLEHTKEIIWCPCRDQTGATNSYIARLLPSFDDQPKFLQPWGVPAVPFIPVQTWAVRKKVNKPQAATYHYNVANDFYALWLDQRMVYSCAYFETAEEDPDTAQARKLDYLCRKLRLRPAERLLDIGCGWGGLIIHAARHYGMEALGITLSQNQAKLANERIEGAGLQNRCPVEVRDYRDLDDTRVLTNWRGSHCENFADARSRRTLPCNSPCGFRLIKSRRHWAGRTANALNRFLSLHSIYIGGEAAFSFVCFRARRAGRPRSWTDRVVSR